MNGRGEKGFSLIEVLIAMFILAVGLLALSSMQGTFATGSAESRRMMRAMDLAMSRLNTLKTLDYASSSLADVDGNGGAGLDETGTDADQQNTVTSYPSQYNVYWNIVENTSANLKRIRVIVEWNNGENSVSLDWVKPRSL
jgi:prepilin-type N-terminal cleavage/methylation domain-containing protein